MMIIILFFSMDTNLKVFVLPFCMFLIGNSNNGSNLSSDSDFVQEGRQNNIEMTLRFSNKTGSCFGDAPLNNFINFLNKASTIYQQDYEKNLKYIQQNMDIAFGSPTQKYNIFIQPNSSYQSAYLVHPMGKDGCNYASLSQNANLINPDWSYLIIKNQYLTYSPSYVYVEGVRKGAGVSSQMQQTIQSIIKTSEMHQFSCLCVRMNQIANNLKAKDGQDWNIICETGYYSHADFTHSYFVPKSDQWIFTKPAQCSYLLYVQ